MAMNVSICGPNLNDQSNGSFHLHRTGCADLRNYGRFSRYGGEYVLCMDATTLQQVVERVYADHMAENEAPWDTWEPYRADFHVLPCAKELLDDQALRGTGNTAGATVRQDNTTSQGGAVQHEDPSRAACATSATDREPTEGGAP